MVDIKDFKNEIINKINDLEKSDNVDYIIENLMGITWLQNYSGCGLDDDLPNCYEIMDTDKAQDDFEDIIENTKDKNMKKYYKKALDYLENDYMGDSIYVKPSGNFDAKVVAIDKNDIKKIVKDIKNQVMESNFNKEDIKDFEANKNELVNLVG